MDAETASRSLNHSHNLEMGSRDIQNAMGVDVNSINLKKRFVFMAAPLVTPLSHVRTAKTREKTAKNRRFS
jgi:hypothetical protein